LLEKISPAAFSRRVATGSDETITINSCEPEEVVAFAPVIVPGNTG
jgi:hypothetical protein